MNVLARLDRLLERLTELICTTLVAALVAVVLYSVVMRYCFLNPPFWGDIIAIFTNVAMVLLGISISVRHRDLVAMQALYEILPQRVVDTLGMVWNILILIFACLFTWYGYQTALTVGGEYWELGMLPRFYPMLILPVSGALLILSSIRVVLEDVRRLNTPRPAAQRQASSEHHSLSEVCSTEKV